MEDHNLMVGFDTSDDAAVYRIDENTAMIQTVDLFPPMVDDPYLFGQIAAANAISDVYAMGGSPKMALNILCYPEDLPKEVVGEILHGGYEKVKEAEAMIAGGHTIKDHEPKYGLSVTGFAKPDRIITNCNAKPGDLLILTKPLGTGILATALKAGLLGEPAEAALVSTMAMLNKKACLRMSDFPVNSCTDITGFGLLGHAYEMAASSGVTISLKAGAVPLLPEAGNMARMGVIPVGAYANREYLGGKVMIETTAPLEILDVLFDPQTSGGLLISLPEKDAGALVKILKDEIPCAEIIGHVLQPGAHSVIVQS
jgi:selenide,water dikinase